MNKLILLLLLTFPFLLLGEAAPQQPPQKPQPQPPIRVDEEKNELVLGYGPKKEEITERPSIESTTRDWTTIEIILSVGVLIFGIIILILTTIMTIKIPTMQNADIILKMNGLTLVIVSAILLITAGYSNDQISGVSGLLGVIAGYLLGSKGKNGD